jgi:hypothetical protein
MLRQRNRRGELTHRAVSLTTEAENGVICVISLHSAVLYWTRLVGSAFDTTPLLTILPRLAYRRPFERTGQATRGTICPLSTSLRGLPYYHPSVTVMSQNLPEAASSSDYEVIFVNALKAYKRKTGRDLASDPLLHRLETCNSPDSVLALLRQQIPGFDQSGSRDERLTNWVNPVVNVLCTFASTISGAVNLVSPGKSFFQDLRSNVYF